MKWMRILALGGLFVLYPVVSETGGEGFVALQTADSSCGDDSSDIYVDCGNGTVTDNRTSLVWLKNANCVGGVGVGVDWHVAMEFVAGLGDISPYSVVTDSDCGLSDGSSPGEWRLPKVDEFEVMVADALGIDGDPDCKDVNAPSITDDSGDSCWAEGLGSSFSSVEDAHYWSSTTYPIDTTKAAGMNLSFGVVTADDKTVTTYGVWPVRGGQ